MLCFAQHKEQIQMGDAYLKTKQFEKAIVCYDTGLKMIKSLKSSHAEIYLNKGYAELKVHAYEKALVSFKICLEIGEDIIDDLSKTRIEQYKTICTLAIKHTDTRNNLLQHPINVKINNLGNKINSKYDDYAPTISADGTLLIFASRRNTTTGGGLDLNDGLYFEDFYYSTRSNQASIWKNATNLKPPINTDDHESIPCISSDGQQVYFYKSLPQNKKNENETCGNGDIYFAKLKGKTWTNPKLLQGTVNTEYWESHPSISSDGKTFYFVSDKPGGVGGRDIYKSELNPKTGNWENTINLGEPINTPYDEAGPFIHPDNKTLYFSSKGHPGIGGYDVFISRKTEQNKWEAPENIGFPVNSEGDDVFFKTTASGQYAYTSSERANGTGGMDIYEIEFIQNNDSLKTDKMPDCVVLIKGTIKEAGDGKLLEASLIFENLDKGIEISRFTSNSETGNYLIVVQAGETYGITVEKEGYLYHSGNIQVAKENCTYREIIEDIELYKIQAGTSFTLNNIFFEYDDWKLLPQSILELNRLVDFLKTNQSLKIEIAGHTDSNGSDEYNLNLSQKRTESMLFYLTDKGIQKERLIAKGYGESKPVAPNIKSDGSDNAEGRKLNRRSEIMILGNAM